MDNKNKIAVYALVNAAIFSNPRIIELLKVTFSTRCGARSSDVEITDLFYVSIFKPKPSSMFFTGTKIDRSKAIRIASEAMRRINEVWQLQATRIIADEKKPSTDYVPLLFSNIVNTPECVYKTMKSAGLVDYYEVNFKPQVMSLDNTVKHIVHGSEYSFSIDVYGRLIGISYFSRPIIDNRPEIASKIIPQSNTPLSVIYLMDIKKGLVAPYYLSLKKSSTKLADELEEYTTLIQDGGINGNYSKSDIGITLMPASDRSEIVNMNDLAKASVDYNAKIFYCTRYNKTNYGPQFKGSVSFEQYDGWDDFINKQYLTIDDKIVIIAMSENEGKCFDVLQSYDSEILTVGAMQKTIKKEGYGEFPRQVAEFKKSNYEAYLQLFEKQGWFVEYIGGGDPDRSYEMYYIDSKDGKKYSKKELKSLIREEFTISNYGKTLSKPMLIPIILAARHPLFKSKQIVDFIARLKKVLSLKPKGYSFLISDYIKSNLGKALVLDQHVNRPGYVSRDLGKAIDSLLTKHQHIDKNPNMWAEKHTQYEELLIEEYGPNREMTHPLKRYNALVEKLGTFLLFAVQLFFLSCQPSASPQSDDDIQGKVIIDTFIQDDKVRLDTGVYTSVIPVKDSLVIKLPCDTLSIVYSGLLNKATSNESKLWKYMGLLRQDGTYIFQEEGLYAHGHNAFSLDCRIFTTWIAIEPNSFGIGDVDFNETVECRILLPEGRDALFFDYEKLHGCNSSSRQCWLNDDGTVTGSGDTNYFLLDDIISIEVAKLESDSASYYLEYLMTPARINNYVEFFDLYEEELKGEDTYIRQFKKLISLIRELGAENKARKLELALKELEAASE